jgi:hypothetical protein
MLDNVPKSVDLVLLLAVVALLLVTAKLLATSADISLLVIRPVNVFFGHVVVAALCACHGAISGWRS